MVSHHNQTGNMHSFSNKRFSGGTHEEVLISFLSWQSRGGKCSCASLLNKRLLGAAGTQRTFQITEFTDTGYGTHTKLGHVRRTGESQNKGQPDGKTQSTPQPGMVLNLESLLSLTSWAPWAG